MTTTSHQPQTSAINFLICPKKREGHQFTLRFQEQRYFCSYNPLTRIKLISAMAAQENDHEWVLVTRDHSEGNDQKYILVDDEELQQYLFAIISARTVGPLNTIKQIGLFMNEHFEKSTNNKTAAPLAMPRCQDTLDYMSDTLEAVDFFVEFCILIFIRGYGASPSTSREISSFISGRRPAQEKARLLSTTLPLSMFTARKRQIRRALLRFQLYCELFHQPGDNSSESISDWEERLEEQEAFWLRYEWWEVEEVKCIYQVLIFCFENTTAAAESLQHLSSSETPDAEQSDNQQHQQRGLVQLRRFLDDSIAPPTAFGAGYLRRFMARSFHGFRRADPDDFGHFSQPRPLYMPHHVAAGVIPAGSYRTLVRKCEETPEGRRMYTIRQGPGKTRKWVPSPYPGVQLEHFKRCPPYEYRAVPGNEKEKRQFLRLIGWVFWRGSDLSDWVEFNKSFTLFRLESGEIDEDWDAPRGLYNRRPFRWVDCE